MEVLAITIRQKINGRNTNWKGCKTQFSDDIILYYT